MSKYGFTDKDSSSRFKRSNNEGSSFETEVSLNTVAALNDIVSPFQPVEVCGRANRKDLILGAELMQKRGAARAAYFPEEMFGEVAWNIMITLYVEEEKRYLSITSIAMMNYIPMSTLLRWIKYLEVRMLVTTVQVVTDARVKLLKMTDKGRNAMDECMTDLLRI